MADGVDVRTKGAALNQAELKRHVPLHRTIGRTTGWPPWLFWRSAVPDPHEGRLGAPLSRVAVAAPVQGQPWDLGGDHLPPQLVQPRLHMTAAPAVHPPPIRLAAGLLEMPEAEAAAAGEAGLLLGCRLRCRIGDRRRLCQGPLARTRLRRLKRSTICTAATYGMHPARPDGDQLATDTWPTQRPSLAGYRKSTPAMSARAQSHLN